MNSSIKQKQMTPIYIGLVAAMISISAFIRIPNPYLPFTLQAMVVFLIPIVFGARISFYGVLIYLVLGLIGLPIFASGGGLSYVLKPSFGFLIGYLFAVIPAGLIVKKIHGMVGYFLSGLSTLIIYNIFGLIYFYFSINYIQSKDMEFITAFKVAILPFILPDMIKIVLAVLLAPAILKVVKFKK